MDDKAGSPSSQSQNEVNQVPSEVPNFDPSILNGLSPSTTSAWLERETNRIMTYNALIQRYRNTLAPIHRFPNEILIRILKFVMGTSVYGQYTQPSKILFLSHVCSWWRQVIENDPFLWTRIHYEDNKQLVELFLKRSRTVNINLVSKKLTDEDADQFLDLITPHAHRISSLTVSSPSHVAMQTVLSHLFLLAPTNLQDLDVSMSSTRRLGLPTPVVDLPMIAGPAKLRGLSLNSVILSLDLPVYSGLSRLQIICPFSRETRPVTPGFTTTQVIRTLRGCPNLEELSLWNVLFGEDETFESPLQRSSMVELPKLSVLKLQDKLYEIPFFLFHLILPRSEHIVLETSWPSNIGETNKNNNVIDTVRQVAPSHDLACLKQVTSLVMGYSELDGALQLIGRHCEKAVFDVKVDSLVFSVKGASSLAQALCTASIRSLALQFPVFPVANANDWLELLQVLPGLSILTLSCGREGMHHFSRRKPERTKLVVEALGEVATRHVGLICPELEELEMRGLYYDEDIGSSLRQTLASRLAQGAPKLKRLSLINIHVLKKMPPFDFTKYCETVVLKHVDRIISSSDSDSSDSDSDDIDDGGGDRDDSEDDEGEDTDDGEDNEGEDTDDGEGNEGEDTDNNEDSD